MHLVRGMMLVALVLSAPRAARPACDDTGAVADARDAIELACPCAGAASHRSYVACATGVIAARLGDHSLPIGCGSTVRRCVTRSTCGRAGAATCCRTTATGVTRCRTTRDPARCAPPVGGSACVGSATSCCDACTTSGCAPTTTTTTTIPAPCGNFPACNGACPPGLVCEIADDMAGLCGCFPDGSQPCGDAGFPFCNGTCPAGAHCGPLIGVPDGPCACVPDGQTACGSSSAPTCGGACVTVGQTCAAGRVGTFTFCGCTDVPCACSTLGVCPGGQFCEFIGTCGCVP
jgi:hypothetical protein